MPATNIKRECRCQPAIHDTGDSRTICYTAGFGRTETLMNPQTTVQVVAGVLCVLLIVIVILRRKSKKKTDDDF